MHTPTAPSRSVAPTTGALRFGTAVWRIAAALLYAFSLVLIPLGVPGAVAALLAALLCFPESREALHQRTGFRLGGPGTALVAVALVVGAVLSTGWPAATTSADTPTEGAVVISDSQAGQP